MRYLVGGDWNMLFFHHIWDNSGYISITQLYMELLLVGGDWNMDNMAIEIVDLPSYKMVIFHYL